MPVEARRETHINSPVERSNDQVAGKRHSFNPVSGIPGTVILGKQA